MAHDHRGAEMSAIVKWLLFDTLQILVARLGRLTPCWGQRTHRLCQAWGSTESMRQLSKRNEDLLPEGIF